jgi:hypothetical protein
LEWPGTDLVLTILRDRLNDANADVRLAAVEGLRDARDHQSAARLRERFALEKDPRVRLALVNSLGQFRDVNAAPLLAKLLRSTETPLVNEALIAAGELGSNSPALLSTAITNFLAEPNRPMDSRITALDALGQFRLASATPWFVRSAQSTNEGQRPASFEALVR